MSKTQISLPFDAAQNSAINCRPTVVPLPSDCGPTTVVRSYVVGRTEDGSPSDRSDPASGRDEGWKGPETRITPISPQSVPATLRPYQWDSIHAIEAAWSSGQRAPLLELATGLGKTVVAAALIHRLVARGRRHLFVAHRDELIDQTLRKLRDAGVEAEREQGEDRASLQARCVVASVQSLQRRRLSRFSPEHFDDLTFDEAHHAISPSWMRVAEHFGAARLVGLTATPYRGDGKPLGKLFSGICYSKNIRAGIREGWLAPLSMRRVKVTDLDLQAIEKVAGDYNQAQLAAALSGEKTLHQICAPLVELAGERPTVVFCVSVANAYQMAEALRDRYGRRAVALDGNVKKSERKEVIAAFERGEHQFLINCAIFTEGFDSPRIGCVAMAAPTLSKVRHVQMIGRGLRLFPDKSNCLGLDFVGNSRHGLISTVDIFAGDVSDDVRDAIEALMMREGVDLDTAIEAERERERERKAALAKHTVIAVAAYQASEVDPFLGEHMHKIRPETSTPITDEYVRAMKDVLGIPRKEIPPGMSCEEAQRWLDAANVRRRRGLASFKQCRALKRAFIDEVLLRKMPVDRANKLCAILSVGDSKRGIDPWHPSLLNGVPERKGNIR